jgi:hypothetical protein
MTVMRIDRRVVVPLCALVCAVAGAIAPADAMAKAELSVSPTIVELEADAGETLTQQISVKAGDDEGIVVELVHADFGFDDSSYQVTLIRDDASDTTAFSTRDWFTLPKRQYRIAKGRTVQLPLTIAVPPNTPAGTYLGAALIRVVPADAAPGASQVQAVPETGPLLFISVAGGDPPKAAVKRFDVPGWVKHGPIAPKIVVENTGDEFFTYEGTLTLKGPGKDTKVDVTRQFVVPGQPRRLATSADEKGRSGHPTLGRKKLGFGKYVIEARLRIEPTGKTLVTRRTVWVIPTWVWTLGIIAALVFAICAALVIRWILERRRLAPFLAQAAAEVEREQRSTARDDSADADGDEDGFDEIDDDVDEDHDDLADDEIDEDDLDEDSLDDFGDEPVDDEFDDEDDDLR